jgi:MFS family permease
VSSPIPQPPIPQPQASPSPRRLRRDLRLITADGIVFSIHVGLGETYLAAFALATGGSPVLAGLLAALPMVAGGALQLVAPSLLPYFPTYRASVVLGAAIQAASFLPLVAAALAADAPPALLFACAAVYWAAGLATAPGWNAWMTQLVPSRVRGSFFGRRQAVAQIGVLVGLLAGGLILDRAGSDRRAFAILFVAAFLCRALSTFFLSRQSVPPGRPRPHGIRARHLLLRAWRSPSRELIATILIVHFAVNLASPFFTPFFLVERDVSYAVFMALLAANFAGKIATYPLLGRIARRAGLRQLMAIGGLGIAPLPLLWPVLPLPYLFLLQAGAGMSWAAFELSVLLAFLDVSDDPERTSLLATFHFLNSAAVAGASLAGGAILAIMGQDRDGYLVIFAVSAIARLIGVAVLLARARRGMAIEVPPLRILAVRPWGEAIVRPVVATLDLARRLGRVRGRAEDEPPIDPAIDPPGTDGRAGRADPPRRPKGAPH